ncbi:hypothetical protein [Moraxella porci]|nr:hypothetical protein [Moraxella porci]MDH2273131.1 hypothetical protein [Moraxella porci]
MRFFDGLLIGLVNKDLKCAKLVPCAAELAVSFVCQNGDKL